MNLSDKDKNILIGRATSIGLKQAWEPIPVITYKKGKNLQEIDANDHPLLPEKYYEVPTAELVKVNHRTALLLVIDRAKDLPELYETVHAYVEKYKINKEAQLKWPDSLKLETCGTSNSETS